MQHDVKIGDKVLFRISSRKGSAEKGIVIKEYQYHFLCRDLKDNYFFSLNKVDIKEDRLKRVMIKRI